MFWRRKFPDPTQQILSIVQTILEKEIVMSAALDSLKADVSSLATEVAQAIALIQANAAATSAAAADAAEITDLQAQVTTLRDQLAAALAPAPVAAPSA